MKARLAALLLGVAGLYPGIAAAHYAVPPPPPTVNPCVPCSGPPAPPAPVPTAPPDALPRVTAVISVSVHLSPSQVRRGEDVTLLIFSIPKAPVTITVHYQQGKPWQRTLRINPAGKLHFSWKVPGGAPLGRGTVAVQVKHSPKPYLAVVSFTVRP